MPSRKQSDVWSGRGWAISLAVIFTAGCPGYLEEQAWLTDAGRVGGYPSDAPVAVTGSGGSPALPAGTGGGGGGGAALNAGTGGAGGGSGSGSGGRRGGDAGNPLGSEVGGPAPAPVVPLCATGPEITSKILMPKCAGCHRANNPAAGLDLASAGAKARLLNVRARCAGKTLVVDNPAVAGHLFDKLGGAVQGCGNRMPLNGTPLSAEEVTCLKAWIKPEAPPDVPSAGPPPCYAPAEIASKILTPKCGSCHGTMMPALGLDLVAAGAKARLLNIPSKACNAKILITPEATGHFFDKLNGAIPGCGNQMPFGAFAPLSQQEIQCLKDWIKPPVQ